VLYVIDRRGFLKASMGAWAAPLVTSALLRGDSLANARWALLSDTHISANTSDSYRGFKPHQNLAKVCGQLKTAKFNAILFNGDLARMEGRRRDYQQFINFVDPLADHAPLVMTLGNHDDRSNARDTLTKLSGDRQRIEKKLVTTIESGPFRFVLLDSLFITNIIAGRLGKSQCDWLSASLAENREKPTIVIMHHNPVGERVGALLDRDRLLEILDGQRQVKALIYGHTHTYRFEQRNGLHLINLPAVAYNFANGEAVGWVEANFSLAGADFKLHAIAGETKDDGKTTSVNWR
jgi:3',5'-cyclic-AMP phosphodiesterase